MTARCPFCEAVHRPSHHEPGSTLVCPCGAVAWFCAPGREPETAIQMDAAAYRDTRADVLDERLSVVWGRS